MLILRGAPALSAFRHGKLLAQLSDKVPAVSGLYAEFAHFAEVSGTLLKDQWIVTPDEEDHRREDQLLTATRFGHRSAI